MSPHLRRTTRRYEAALRLNPPVGFVAGWPVKLPPAGGISGLGGFWDDLWKTASGPVTQSIDAQVTELKSALKLIIGLSAIAAGTGIISFFRR